MMPNGTAEKEMRATVEGILKVYTIPVILKKVLEVVENERSSISDLVEVIQHDQALSSKIVATSNTVFYGFRRNISSIPNAAVILGLNMVRSLAVSVSVFRCASGDLAFLKKLWQHSFETALAASLISERTGLVKKEDAFLAGLIHDLGRAILYQIHGEKYLRLSAEGAEEGLPDREVAAFGASHSQVGAWFVDKYRFPKECVFAIEYHHDPENHEENNTAKTLASIVHLADFIAMKGKKEMASEPPSEKLAGIMKAIYLDEQGVEEIKEKLSGMEDMIKEFYAS